jgi:hypothetical protein
MGTLDFKGQFKGMLKTQQFVVYPKASYAVDEVVKIQSDTRIGSINLQTGQVKISKSHASGADHRHLAAAVDAGVLSGEQLLLFKAHVMATSSSSTETNAMVVADNCGATGAVANTTAPAA